MNLFDSITIPYLYGLAVRILVNEVDGHFVDNLGNRLSVNGIPDLEQEEVAYTIDYSDKDYIDTGSFNLKTGDIKRSNVTENVFGFEVKQERVFIVIPKWMTFRERGALYVETSNGRRTNNIYLVTNCKFTKTNKGKLTLEEPVYGVRKDIILGISETGEFDLSGSTITNVCEAPISDHLALFNYLERRGEYDKMDIVDLLNKPKLDSFVDMPDLDCILNLSLLGGDGQVTHHCQNKYSGYEFLTVTDNRYGSRNAKSIEL